MLALPSTAGEALGLLPILGKGKLWGEKASRAAVRLLLCPKGGRNGAWRGFIQDFQVGVDGVAGHPRAKQPRVGIRAPGWEFGQCLGRDAVMEKP